MHWSPAPHPPPILGTISTPKGRHQCTISDQALSQLPTRVGSGTSAQWRGDRPSRALESRSDKHGAEALQEVTETEEEEGGDASKGGWHCHVHRHACGSVHG